MRFLNKFYMRGTLISKFVKIQKVIRNKIWCCNGMNNSACCCSQEVVLGCIEQSWAHRSLKSLFALERTLILGAMALLNKKSEAQ